MRKVWLVLILSLASMPAFATTLVTCGPPCPDQAQNAFKTVSEDAVALIDYKALEPAASTGLVSLGFGVQATYLPVKKSDWAAVSDKTDLSGIGAVGLQVVKGLPLDIDVGAFYSAVPSAGIKVYGGELRYAILAGSAVSPALSIGGSYVKLTGVDKLDLSDKAVDLRASKGFPIATPYVGVGYVWGDSKPDASTNFKEVKVNKTKAYIGARFSLGFFDIVPEVGEVGKDILYNLKLGFSFSL